MTDIISGDMIKTFIVVRFLLVALAATLVAIITPNSILEKLKRPKDFQDDHEPRWQLKF